MEQVDDVTILIEDKLRLIVPFVPEFSIHRVPKGLFSMNSYVYVPKEVSIGPYRRDKNKFKKTENLKLRFFVSYLHRRHTSIDDIVKMARVWEEEARQYYSDDISMKSEEFVEMMVLDGCFIVEFLIMIFSSLFKIFPKNEKTVHFSFYESISSDIGRDLIMLENQLPLFVLQGLFDPIYYIISDDVNDVFGNGIDSDDFFLLVVNCFLIKPLDITNIKPSYTLLDERPRHLLDFFCSLFAGVTFRPEKAIHVFEDNKLHSPSATELTEAGIILEKAIVDETGHVHICLKNGILNILPLLIDDRFETYTRNLLAFSQFSGQEYYKNKSIGIALDYFLFLHGLITTEKDVKLLVDKGIILNQIGGSNKQILELLNSMWGNITLLSSDAMYKVIGTELQLHCKRSWSRQIRRWNRWNSKWKEWMFIFRNKYLSTPWTVISILAATFLLILTLLQTIFAGISFFKENPL